MLIRSGDGTLHLHRYSTTSRQWTALGPYIASNSNNAYLNGISAAAGRVFASWTVRETPNANTNHDFHFAYSNDEGVTWFNTNGKQLPKPFLADNADTKVFEIPQNSRLVNQESQIVDNAGRFHALMRDDLSGSQSYNHYYRDLAGKRSYQNIWHPNLRLTVKKNSRPLDQASHQRKPQRTCRPLPPKRQAGSRLHGHEALRHSS